MVLQGQVKHYLQEQLLVKREFLSLVFLVLTLLRCLLGLVLQEYVTYLSKERKVHLV